MPGRGNRGRRGRGRGRARGRGRERRSQAPQGRNLMQVNTLLDKRLQEYPNQSFTKYQNKLLCQACNVFIDFTRNSTCKRHCGLDQRQAARSNTGSDHKRKLREWQNPDPIQANVRPTSARSTWILGNVLAGTNAVHF